MDKMVSMTNIGASTSLPEMMLVTYKIVITSKLSSGLRLRVLKRTILKRTILRR